MKSIQRKFIVLQVVSIIFCTLGVGTIGILSVHELVDKNNSKIVELMCENEAQKIDLILAKVQQAVDIFTVSVKQEIPDVSLLSTEKSLGEVTARIQNTVIPSAEKTDGTVAVYLRYNPELTNPTAGFFMERSEEDNSFVNLVPTDISAFEKDDVEHVGWYYIPTESKKPLWMEPYDNLNLDITMISYVVPIYIDGTTVGVVGMDIDFELLIDAVKGVSLYDSGYAYLMSQDDTVLYHPNVVAGNMLVQEPGWIYHGCKLSNGMSLVITVPKEELYKARNQTMLYILMVALTLLVVFILISIIVARSIVKPLKVLNAAAIKLANGEMDVDLNIKSDDEVGELARSFKKTSDHLKHYIEYINGLAYRDSLTGVKNKTSYDSYVKQIGIEIKQDENIQFAIVMFDVNGLKEMNDSHGHEYGNLLLVHCCRHICSTFSHSPVFRIGGDEFVAVLKNADYKNRNLLLKNFETQMQLISSKTDMPYQKISIAFGMAEYDPTKDHGVEVVFNRADENMYEKKKSMKGFN